MKRIPAVLLALSLLLSAAPAEAGRRRIVQRSTEALLPIAQADALAASALAAGTPGISIAVANGGAVFTRGYGHATSARAAAIETGTIFQIASLTKQFTAAAILALEEERRLSVSDPVTRWIPELDLGSRTVTLHHLLTHTSGLRAETEFFVDPYTPVAEAEMIRLIATRGFASEPGAAEAYNNAGYWLLGVVIERASGVPYPKFLEERFFVPLGLTRTAYCGTGPAVPIPAGSFELLGYASPTRPVDMSIAGGAGAICSTAADLVAWSRALASGDAISTGSYQRMITPARLNDGTQLDYGYGLGLGSIGGVFTTSHAGTIPGFETYMIDIPSRQVTVAVLVNAVSATRSWAREIARELAARTLAAEP